MRLHILLIIFTYSILFSCGTRQGGATNPPAQVPPSQPATQACAGTVYQGTCYPGGDSDGDGASDGLENKKGSDPLKADSDGDGANDLCEILKNTNPTDANSKPTDCDFSKAPAPEKPDLDPVMKATCALFQAQKNEEKWFNENLKTEQKCTNVTSKEKDGKEITKKVCEDITKSSSSSVSAENLGDPEEATLVTMTVKVKWGVSYKDVLMVSNGVISLRPWFKFFYQYVDDYNDDDRQFDHHLGDLPSTSDYCEEGIKNKAIVTVSANGDTKEMTWEHPAFIPFKIPQYEKVYPFSTDGFQLLNENSQDEIEFMGSPLNNFSFKTHLASVQVLNTRTGADDNESDNNCDEDDNNDGNTKCKQQNNLCETREVEFKYDYWKVKTDEDGSTGYDYADIENICKDIKL